MSLWLNTARVIAVSGALSGLVVLSGCSSGAKRTAPAQPYADRSGEVNSLVKRGDDAAARGDSESAVAHYQQAVTIDPQRYVAWNNMGVELMKMNNYLDAVAAFRVAADLSPRDPRPVSNIGLAYQEMGWAQDALINYEDALRRDPNYLDALRGIAVAEQNLGYASLESLNRVRHALMIEPDEQWREFFQRQRFRIENQLRRPVGSAS